MQLDERMTEYLDARIGSHEGGYPERQWPCPFCIDRLGSESDKRKFRINVKTAKGNCPRCEYKFVGWKMLLMALNGGRMGVTEQSLLKSESNAVVASSVASTVSEMLGGVLHHASPVVEKLRPVRLPQDFIPLESCDNGRLLRGPKYLEARGDRDGVAGTLVETACALGVGYCPRGEYAGRIIFPVVQNGVQVYFTDRYAGEQSIAKSKNPKNREGYMTAAHCLLNYDNAAGRKVVALVEGPLDMLGFVDTLGVDNPEIGVAGLMGKSLSAARMHLFDAMVEQGTEEFVICTDADAEAMHLWRPLMDRVPKVSVVILDYGDPFSRRAEAWSLLESRHGLSVEDAVRQALGVSK